MRKGGLERGTCSERGTLDKSSSELRRALAALSDSVWGAMGRRGAARREKRIAKREEAKATRGGQKIQEAEGWD